MSIFCQRSDCFERLEYCHFYHSILKFKVRCIKLRKPCKSFRYSFQGIVAVLFARRIRQHYTPLYTKDIFSVG
ncbi:MAG: hypothetical protein IJM97_03435 [Clostridia bacterium]|nr:hypothetical protein [Clostridia bacterium]